MDFSQSNGKIWVDGELIPSSEATVHLLSHSLHYGVGVFEGLRCYPTQHGLAIFRLADHMQRLLDSAKIIQLSFDESLNTLCNQVCEVVKHNELSHGYIRPMVYLGSEQMGLRIQGVDPHFMCAAWEWGNLFTLAEDVGINVMTSSIRRVNVNSSFIKAKANGHYLNSSIALREANQRGYDDAILLDHLGFVAEGSAANLFMVKNNEVITPPLTSILAGITRDTLLRLVADLNLPCHQRYFTVDEMYTADEAFFTGTALEITPIQSIDDRQISTQAVGPITQRLRERYHETVRGKLEVYRDWLTVVS